MLPPPPYQQLIVDSLGGKVKEAEGGGEYGRMPMSVVRESTLFATETADSQLVWMSHGDEAVQLPDGFNVVARSEQVGGLLAGQGSQGGQRGEVHAYMVAAALVGSSVPRLPRVAASASAGRDCGD